MALDIPDPAVASRPDRTQIDADEQKRALTYTAQLLPAKYACQVIKTVIMSSPGNMRALAPVSNMLIGSVAEGDIGKASGANNTVREVGGALGIAVMTAIFTGAGLHHVFDACGIRF